MTQYDADQDTLYLSHAEMLLLQDGRQDTFALAENYDAAPLSPVIDTYMKMETTEKDKVFYLEGGKTFYLDGGTDIYKGIVLATNPKDVAEGKRARVICGIGRNPDLFFYSINGEQWQSSYSLFMIGRQPEEAESGEIYMNKIAFYDIDFDNPTALNYGDMNAGLGTSTGNYFFNMYSDGMAVTLDSLVIENCTFKRLVRGFVREQGPNYKIWNNVLIKNNQFFDCGYYNIAAGGYPWIAGAGTNNKTNLFKNMVVTENTFYDSPFPSLLCQATDGMEWESGAWNITFSNNTLINFNTRACGNIFNMRCLPDGSVYNVRNNLFVLTKQEGDQRVLGFWGADIRGTQPIADGTPGVVTLNFENNWSTSDNLTNGSIFSANPWTSTKNNFGSLIKNGQASLNGSLEVNVADVSSTELFTSPCPPHVAQTERDQHMHRADALDGTAETMYNVNLYYQSLDNDIYNNNIGDPRWREKSSFESIEAITNGKGRVSVCVDLLGRKVAETHKGQILIQNGKKIIVR